MRDSHTLTRFGGIDTQDAEINVRPARAIGCMNVLAGPSGELWVMRDTQTVIDFATTPDQTVNLARILSIGALDNQAGGAPIRLVVQQGSTLIYADGPAFLNPTLTTGLALPATPARLSYAQSNSVLYFSNGLGGGKLLSGNPQVYKWGISPPLQPPTQIASTTFLGVVSIQRAADTVTLQFGAPHGSFAGDPVYVDAGGAGAWDASYAGLFVIASTPAADTVTYAQAGANSGPFARATFPNGITCAAGYQYRMCFGCSLTGHWSTATAPTATIGPFTSQSPLFLSPLPPDPQIDQMALFRNLDGGGDWYLVDTYPIPPAGNPPFDSFPGRVPLGPDTISDDVLESSAQTPPYDNGISPNGKYICANVDRILMCGIEGSQGVVKYSGYDSINFGRPQESWPLYNSIAIGQGQAIPNAIGMTRYGAVIFTNKGWLYIIRGTLQDITVSAPQAPSFQLTLLPFNIGAYSHFSLQTTPSGLVFLSDGLELMVFDGYYEPTRIAPVLNGIFQRITPGLQDLVASVYISDLNRQWYVCSFPVDGSLQNNLTVIVDMNPDQERNAGSWVSDLSIDDIIPLNARDGSKGLYCAQSQFEDGTVAALAGKVTTLPLFYDAADPATTLLPNAHWRSGYFGIKDEDGVDEMAFFKLFRTLRFATSLPGVTVMAYLVDGDTYTFDQPYVQKFDFNQNYGSLNIKSRAISLDIIFPPGSAAPISALTQSWNFCGKR